VPRDQIVPNWHNLVGATRSIPKPIHAQRHGVQYGMRDGVSKNVTACLMIKCYNDARSCRINCRPSRPLSVKHEKIHPQFPYTYARLHLRHVGEGVTQRMETALQPDKETGVGSYLVHMNDKLQTRSTRPSQYTGKSGGRRYFISGPVLSLGESGRS